MALLWMPQGPEWLLILLAILLLFGATRVPQLMRGLGQGVREFKKAINDDEPIESEKPAESNKPELKSH